MRTILLDVDDVCADLLGTWLRRYNALSGDSLTPDRVHGWDIGSYTLPGWSQRIYSLLADTRFYTGVPALPGALAGVEALRQLGRVVFVTSANTATLRSKVHWLEREGFLPASPRHGDLIIAHDKSLIRGDLLIDDGPHNVEAFAGPSILFDQAHNRSLDHPLRATDWSEVTAHAELALSHSFQ